MNIFLNYVACYIGMGKQEVKILSSTTNAPFSRSNREVVNQFLRDLCKRKLSFHRAHSHINKS
ncbi:hypothetical protein Avbf_08211 [Armadillidium vulgare]|nr:hypothetical protein Avbf_08211 [Armadillidium vulgare]